MPPDPEFLGRGPLLLGPLLLGLLLLGLARTWMFGLDQSGMQTFPQHLVLMTMTMTMTMTMRIRIVR